LLPSRNTLHQFIIINVTIIQDLNWQTFVALIYSIQQLANNKISDNTIHPTEISDHAPTSLSINTQTYAKTSTI